MLMLILDLFLEYHLHHYGKYNSKCKNDLVHKLVHRTKIYSFLIIEDKAHKLRNYMIFFVWMNSLFWGLTPLFGWSRIGYEPTNTSCTVDIMNPDLKYITYIIFCGIWCYLLPIIAMIYCRVRMIRYYEIMPKDVYFNYKVKHFNQGFYQDLIKTFERSFNIFKMIMVLIILFLIEWTPYAVVYLWPIFDDPKNIPLKLSLAGPVIAKTSVVLNPLFYLIEMSTQKLNERLTRKV